MTLERVATRRTVYGIAAAVCLGLVASTASLAPVEPPRAPVAVEPEPPASCRRHPFSMDFQVCVIDELGRPLAGVTVYGAYTRYSGSGPYTDSAGWVTTDATGLATFQRARHSNGSPREMWAIADRAGWPPQAELSPGTIVLGPPRTMHGVLHFAKPCTNVETRIGVNNEWSHWGYPQPAYVHLDLAPGKRAFRIENLGPGPYEVTVYACDDEDAQEWKGVVRGSELVGRTLELPLALDPFP